MEFRGTYYSENVMNFSILFYNYYYYISNSIILFYKKKFSLTKITNFIINYRLSYKDAKIKHVLNLESSRQKTTLLLMGFNQTEGYLERLMAWLIDIDRLIKLIET